ncbi:unnamed protein product [Effrenium voratum]|uniref:Uncharacterized protein n=1 Tax=Effrenium voratum TaxID=2562239 RepID=A0AA36J7U1_9DINO|nr:unnamed protein product [Effrenium voratum]CAJ1400052.1 unnamed protein product [Effrenium voratum]CAJ1441337.1 unnamed protein product [Effrenium voratum]
MVAGRLPGMRFVEACGGVFHDIAGGRHVSLSAECSEHKARGNLQLAAKAQRWSASLGCRTATLCMDPVPIACRLFTSFFAKRSPAAAFLLLFRKAAWGFSMSESTARRCRRCRKRLQRWAF